MLLRVSMGGDTELENLALSCTLCNRYKGSDLTSIDPETNQIVRLYNPRIDTWTKHFRLEGARIIPLSAQGRVIIRLLNLNRIENIVERELLFASGTIKLPEN